MVADVLAREDEVVVVELEKCVEVVAVVVAAIEVDGEEVTVVESSTTIDEDDGALVAIVVTILAVQLYDGGDQRPVAKHLTF